VNGKRFISKQLRGLGEASI